MNDHAIFKLKRKEKRNKTGMIRNLWIWWEFVQCWTRNLANSKINFEILFWVGVFSKKNENKKGAEIWRKLEFLENFFTHICNKDLISKKYQFKCLIYSKIFFQFKRGLSDLVRIVEEAESKTSEIWNCEVLHTSTNSISPRGKFQTNQ